MTQQEAKNYIEGAFQALKDRGWFLKTGLVPNFPTLIVCGCVAIAALLSYYSGLILDSIAQKNRQEFEFRLQLIGSEKERKRRESRKEQ